MEWWGILIVSVLGAALFITLSIALYKHFFKRFYDIILSGLAIIVFLPLLFFLMTLGLLALKGNPFFTQARPGKNEKIFKLIKFRTMSNKKDSDGNLLSDKERLTGYGKFLRKTSLDELPQLFNIFIGNMSIIGPRPLLVKYLPLYDDTQRLRHKVRPGLTGLAQVSGRNAIGWEEKFNKDLEYVQKVSFSKDAKIFFKTVGKVFKRSEINQKGEATMTEFKGKKNLAIYCAGGLGKEIYDLAVRNYADKYSEIFFVDDNLQEDSFYGTKIEKFEDLTVNDNIEFSIANGEPFIRQTLAEKIKSAGFSLATLVDKTAVVSPSATLSDGVTVNADSFVSSNTIIAENTYLQQLSTIGHDVLIGANCVISSLCQVSGQCAIGDAVYVGVGSCIREGVSVGGGSIIGMGSFVHENIDELVVAYGNPAKKIRKNESKRVFG